MSIKESRLSNPATDGRNVQRQARAVYDFAVHGGAIGTINLGEVVTRTNGLTEVNLNTAAKITLPANAVITRVMYDVVTAVTSGGAGTIALGINTNVDLLAATAVTSSGTVGRHDGISVGSAATSVKVTTDNSPLTLTVGTAALTAGKLVLIVEYFLSA